MSGGGWSSGYLRIWDLATQKLLFSLTRDSEIQASFGPGDSVIVGHMFGSSLSIYQQGDQENPITIDLPGDGMFGLATNADQSLVAFCVFHEHGAFKTWSIQVHETENWQQIWSFNTDNKIRMINFSKTMNRLAWSDESGTAWIARLDVTQETGEIELRRKLHSAGISGIAISPNGKRLATTSWDGFAAVWDIARLQQVSGIETPYPKNDYWPSGVGFIGNKTDETVIGIRSEGVHLWNPKNGTVLKKLPIDVGDATQTYVATSSSGKVSVCTGIWPIPKDKDVTTRLMLWDPAVPTEVEEIVVPALGTCLNSTDMFPNGKYFVATSHHAGVIVVNTTAKPKIVHTISDIDGKSVRCSADNRTVVIGGRNGVAYVLVAPDFDCIEEITLDGRLIDCVDVSVDGQIIAAVGFDKKVKLYDRTTKKTREFDTSIPNFPSLVRLSPDGKRVVTGSLDGVLRMWITETGDLTQAWNYRPFSWPVGEFSSDGQTFLVGGVNYCSALHAPTKVSGGQGGELNLLPSSVLRSRACQNISDIGWD